MEVRIEKLDHFGRGICHVDGQLCFVEDALPDEVVDIQITHSYKKYLEATVVARTNDSICRTIPQCPYAATCGGCQFQHLKFNFENQFKEDKVKDMVERFGDLSPEIVKPILSGEEYSYRNKIILHGSNGLLGLYEKKSNRIVPVQECMLVHPRINQMIPLIQSVNQNIQKVMIKCSNDGKEVLVSIDGDIASADLLMNHCDVLILNGEYLTEKHTIVNPIGDYLFHESLSSFFQVNTKMTEVLYNQVLEVIKDKWPKNALDLYCGTGTIGIYVSPFCEKITGVDHNPSNIEDANQNLILNHVHHISYICDQVENVMDQFQNIDCVIVDPPRNGLDPKTKDILKRLGSQTIIYVSCDPITLARDLKELKEKHDVKSIQPINMFPKTYHCESIAVLEKKI